jgi:hypothetical protein
MAATSETSKEGSKAGPSLFYWVAAVVIMVLLVIGALIVFKPWLLLNPIDRSIYLDAREHSLIPEFLALGEGRDAVDHKLRGAGYSLHFEEQATDTREWGCSESTCVIARYTKSGPLWPIVCDTRFAILLTYDLRQALRVATAHRYESCM